MSGDTAGRGGRDGGWLICANPVTVTIAVRILPARNACLIPFRRLRFFSEPGAQKTFERTETSLAAFGRRLFKKIALAISNTGNLGLVIQDCSLAVGR
jgi:hypothetical protein